MNAPTPGAARSRAWSARIAAVCAAACLFAAPAPSPAGGGEAAYFVRALSGSSGVDIERVVAGPGGMTYACGNTGFADLTGSEGGNPGYAGGWTYFVSAVCPDGTVRWTKYLNPAGSYTQYLSDAVAASDGSVWVAGYGEVLDAEGKRQASREGRYDADAWLARFAPDGALASLTQFGGTSYESVTSVALMPDGDVLVAGSTSSPDFPVSDGSPAYGGRTDGFLARVRSDGSGLVWSRFFGGPVWDQVSAVAADPAGGFVAAHTTHVSAYEYGEPPFHDVNVTRFSDDGTALETTPVPHGDDGGIVSIAVHPDYGTFVAGQTYYGLYWSTTDGYVMRLPPGSSRFDAMWKQRGAVVGRMALAPSGELVLGTDLQFSSYQYGTSDANRSVVRRLGPSLDERGIIVDRDPLGAIQDLSLAADGTVCLAGKGWTSPAGAGDSTMTPLTAFVARLPLSGAAPASHVTATTVSTDTVSLSWDGGDPAGSYRVEFAASDSTWPGSYRPAGEPPGGSNTFEVSGLGSGEAYAMRLVSLFASGAQSSTHRFMAYTKPEPVRRLDAFVPQDARFGVALNWERSPGSNTTYEFERRIGDGPFQPVQIGIPGGYGLPQSGRVYDPLPPLGTRTVTYRIRAVTRQGEFPTRWTYSKAITTGNPTLFVRQTSGQVRAGRGRSWGYGTDRIDVVKVDVTGTISTKAGETTGLDPREDGVLVFYFGEARSPIHASNSLRWIGRHARQVIGMSGRENDGSVLRVRIDRKTGRFEAHAVLHDPNRFDPRSRDFVVGVTYGDLVGGEIRQWTPLPGARPNLVLR